MTEAPTPSPLPDGTVLRASDVGFQIDGIMWDATDPKAMVNDRIVSPGSVVNGIVIEEIQQDSLIVRYQGSRVRVRY